MDSDVSDLLHPAARLGIECFQRADLQTIEEVLLNVPDRVFNAPLFVSPPDITGHWLEAVVCGKIQITRIKNRSVTGEPLEDSRLKIIMHGAPRTCTVVFQRVAIGSQEAFHTLAQEELHVEQSAITEHRGEVVEFAPALAHGHQAMSGPIDLHAIARFKGQFEERLVADRPYCGYEVVKDRSAAGVTMFRAQALQNLHSGIGMFFEPGDDQIFVGIQLAGALGSLAARLVARLVQPFTDGLDIETGLGGDLSGSQIQLPAQTAYLVIGFKVNHCGAPPFCSRLSTIALSDRSLFIMVPMAWGSEPAVERCGGWLLRSLTSPSRLKS